MKNLQKYPSPPKEYLDKLKSLNYQEVKKNDKERIFLYSEFIKRKFYIDCLYTKIQSKRKIQYIEKSFTSDKECFESISDTFISEEDKLSFYMRQNDCRKAFINSFKEYNYNIYSIIRNNFYNNIKILKKLISNPEDYSTRKFVTDGDIEFLKNLTDTSDYVFERILYGVNPLQGYKNKSIEFENNDFANILRILNNGFGWYFDNCFLMLYRYIIDRYSLYMSDLFKITDIENIVSKQYKFTNNSHFFFIPTLNEEEEYIKEYIDINTDDKNKNITIKIKLIESIDSLKIVNYIKQTLLDTLYFYKENHGMKYSDEEISYFFSQLDSPKKHNKSNFTTRINGLYIWDKINIKGNKLSINSICAYFSNKFPNRKGKKVNLKDDINYLRRCYNAVLNSIDTLSFCGIK